MAYSMIFQKDSSSSCRPCDVLGTCRSHEYSLSSAGTKHVEGKPIL
jgi:hypothetical protein